MSRLVSLFLLCACTPGLVDTQVRLGLSDPSEAAAGLGEASACAADADACTPGDLSGRIFSGGAMWGELGPEAWNITMLGENEDVIQDPSQGMGGVLSFSLVEQTRLAGQYAAPEGGDEARPITRMEFNYDYLDAHFTLGEGSPLAGDWVVRTVFVTRASADDAAEPMRRGDKLVRRAEESAFSWCNTETCSTSRAAVEEGLVQEEKLVRYEHPGQGNPEYIPFAVPLLNDLRLSAEALGTSGSSWTVVFDMTDAVLLHEEPSKLGSPSALLSAFELSYSPDRQHAGEGTAIGVTLGFHPGE